MRYAVIGQSGKPLSPECLCLLSYRTQSFTDGCVNILLSFSSKILDHHGTPIIDHVLRINQSGHRSVNMKMERRISILNGIPDTSLVIPLWHIELSGKPSIRKCHKAMDIFRPGGGGKARSHSVTLGMYSI